MDINVEGKSWNEQYVRGFGSEAKFVKAHSKSHHYENFELEVREKLLGKVYSELPEAKKPKAKKKSPATEGDK